MTAALNWLSRQALLLYILTCGRRHWRVLYEGLSSGVAVALASEGALYSVVFHEIGGLLHGDHVTPSLAAALRIAADGVDSRAAKRAEIFDELNRLVMKYPDDDGEFQRRVTTI